MAQFWQVNPADVCNWTIVEYAEALAYMDFIAAPDEAVDGEIWNGR